MAQIFLGMEGSATTAVGGSWLIHLEDFVDAYHYARRPKTLGGAAPYAFI